MTDQQASPPTTGESPDPLMAHIAYGLFAVGFLNGITAIIGVILAYVRRPDVKGTFLESHFTYLIRTFWISLLFGIVSALLMIVGIGFILIFAVVIWVIYRIVKGGIKLAYGRAIDDQESWR
ncbi:MAG: DUF4870 family protein [Candidatus Phaeomarinobacter sp.]